MRYAVRRHLVAGNRLGARAPLDPVDDRGKGIYCTTQEEDNATLVP